jgi:uncharacterized protein (TIGR02266 family)
MENQRRFPRAPLSGTVKFYDWDRPLQASATEISPGGIFLRTPQALPEGTLLTLRLSIPGLSQAFTVLGKVVRTVRGGLLRPAGMGVRFIDIPASAQHRILDYVSHRSLQAVA